MRQKRFRLPAGRFRGLRKAASALPRRPACRRCAILPMPDKAAAELLAIDINQTGIKGGVKATQNPVIVPGVLEVWIGQ